MIARRALRSASLLIAHADHQRIAAVRRKRYLRWQQAVAGLAGVRPWRTDYPSSLVPYVYPLVLTRPEEQFRALKYAGVAVWRWDQLAVSGCRVSARLALELVQMPCQHTLSDAQFEALVARFCSVIEAT